MKKLSLILLIIPLVAGGLFSFGAPRASGTSHINTFVPTNSNDI